MKKLHISNSPLSNTIFAGTLLKGNQIWSANKQDVTAEALGAVVDHCLIFQDKTGGNVELTSSTTKFIITIEKVDLTKGEANETKR